MLLSEQAYRKIDLEMEKFPSDKKQSAIIAALAIAQDEIGWLPHEVIEDVAKYLNILPIVAEEVATFYSMFYTNKLGRYKIRVCTNLPCALNGANKIINFIKEKLFLDQDLTSSDGLFSLLEGECFGACSDAPVLIVNNKHMCSYMSLEKVSRLIEEIKLLEQGDLHE